jgi:TolB protein
VGAVLLRAAGEVIPGVARFVDPYQTILEFWPEDELLADTEYELIVQQSVRDLDGMALEGSNAVAFHTAGGVVVPPPLQPPITGQLVFASLTDRQVYTIRADGTARTQLTTAGWNEGPRWSPDGNRIAFSRRDGYGADIYLMDENGSNVVRRTMGSAFWPAERPQNGLRSATWSPNGLLLAVSNEGVYDSDIWLIRADDDGTPPLHFVSNARSPAWSPDGQRIAFVRVSGDDGYDAIGVMNVDGTGESILTPAWGGRYGVAWSPDGKSLAASVCVLGVCDVFVMDADGTNTRRVTDAGTASWGGAWSPDGLWIAATLWGPGGPTVVRVPSEGGVTQVITTDGLGPSWRP